MLSVDSANNNFDHFASKLRFNRCVEVFKVPHFPILLISHKNEEFEVDCRIYQKKHYKNSSNI